MQVITLNSIAEIYTASYTSRFNMFLCIFLIIDLVLFLLQIISAVWKWFSIVFVNKVYLTCERFKADQKGSKEFLFVCLKRNISQSANQIV